MKNKNRHILITGCSSGIGLHLAHTLQSYGYNVIASAREKKDVDALTQDGLRCIQLDVSDSTSIQYAVEKVLHMTGGKLFALINNAGYGQPGAVEDLSRDTLRNQFETNLFGLVELTNKFIPVMLKQGYGRIIQNSSVLGFVAMPLRGAYIASKFALEGITDTLRLELTSTNVFVTLIEPGPILSHFRQNSLNMLYKNIDSRSSRFRKTYDSAITRLKTEGPVVPFTLEPEAVAKKVLCVLEIKKPKARYFVTFPTYLFATLKRILPTSIMDYLLTKTSKVENKSS